MSPRKAKGKKPSDKGASRIRGSVANRRSWLLREKPHSEERNLRIVLSLPHWDFIESRFMGEDVGAAFLLQWALSELSQAEVSLRSMFTRRDLEIIATATCDIGYYDTAYLVPEALVQRVIFGVSRYHLERIWPQYEYGRLYGVLRRLKPVESVMCIPLAHSLTKGEAPLAYEEGLPFTLPDFVLEAKTTAPHDQKASKQQPSTGESEYPEDE